MGEPAVNVLELNLLTARPAPEPASAQGERMTEVPRAQLRVYLGAAPGVGKTYAMLDEGRRAPERGTDVVVGFVETHGRPHTAALLDGLEVVPRRTRRLPGRAPSPRWTSTPSSPGAPQVALVDELAHTNVPGLAATPSAGRTSRSCSTPAST